jgi:hypothetical protein
MELSDLDLDKEDCRKMYRAVLMDAVRDLGFGNEVDRQRVSTWIYRDTFVNACDLACWDDRWVRDLLKSIMAVDPTVRKRVVSESLKILRGVARLTSRTEVMAVGIGGASGRLEADDDLKYIAAPRRLLSRASEKMHKKRDGNGNK